MTHMHNKNENSDQILQEKSNGNKLLNSIFSPMKSVVSDTIGKFFGEKKDLKEKKKTREERSKRKAKEKQIEKDFFDEEENIQSDVGETTSRFARLTKSDSNNKIIDAEGETLEREKSFAEQELEDNAIIPESYLEEDTTDYSKPSTEYLTKTPSKSTNVPSTKGKGMLADLVDGGGDDYDDGDNPKDPALVRFGKDITALAREGKIEECFGRENELSQLMEILVRRQKNNPVLIGEAGVGKTAIVELFASRMVNNLVPFILEGRIIIELDLARVIAGSRYRGEFELRFGQILEEVLAQPNIIIFIDEIHTIGGAGSAEGSLDAANILKPVLSRSGFQCIGATTRKEYEKIEKDPALNRRFQPILVKEPSIEDTVEILFGLRPSLEGFHNVEIQPHALRVAAELSARYISDRFLPDKAIDLVDRTAAREVIKLTSVNDSSLVSSVVNATLSNLGKLRVEAFRRGDIASEFIFQELENAYRNFLLRWVENPTIIPEDVDTGLSPFSFSLFDKMRMVVLKRVDELLFASSEPRDKIRPIRYFKDLSVEQTEEIYKLLLFAYSSKEVPMEMPKLSVYRISSYLFHEWLKIYIFKDPALKASLVYESYIDDIAFNCPIDSMYNYVTEIRKKIEDTSRDFSREQDFLEEDIETVYEKYEYMSELEERKVLIFSDFLQNLRPFFRRGLIQSLRYTANLEISGMEMSELYTLLGYFSTDSGREFLVNLEDPEVIQIARKTGYFTSLKKRINANDIRNLLADMTGIPIQSLSNIESEKLLNLETTLHERVVGQQEGISAIAKAIRRARLGIQNPNRPIASFLFCGPTGVGKTEVTKALAVTLFGSESDMIRFDMSEFMEKFAISRLIGSPPGYVGYDEGGQLTDSVRKKPYSVVLFDEVEKAHPDVLNVLLQILEDGRLTDSQKRLVSFENTILIMTSNAAANEIQQILKENRMVLDQELAKKQEKIEEKTKEKAEENIEEKIEQKIEIYEDPYVGAIKFFRSPIEDNYFSDLSKKVQSEFQTSFRNIKDFQYFEKDLKDLKIKQLKEEAQGPEENPVLTLLKNAVLDRLSTMFLPEFLNRLDDIIIFQPLKIAELRQICDIMIQEVIDRVKLKHIILTVDIRVKTKLTREGYNPLFGARPLRRLVTKYVEDVISETVLSSMMAQKAPLASPSPKDKVVTISVDENDQIIVI